MGKQEKKIFQFLLHDVSNNYYTMSVMHFGALKVRYYHLT